MIKPSPRQCPAWSHNRECACHLSSASPQLLSARFQSSMWCCPFERAQKSCLVKDARTLWKRKSWHFSDWRKISPHFPFSLFQQGKCSLLTKIWSNEIQRETHWSLFFETICKQNCTFQTNFAPELVSCSECQGQGCKMSIFYTDHFCPTKFTPRKSAVTLCHPVLRYDVNSSRWWKPCSLDSTQV